MSAAITIRSLGKRYRVNHAVERAPYRTLRDSLARAAAAPSRRLRSQRNGATEEFWALKNVELDVQPGEVIGVIGRNGAGKSTLLKILSRITSPTTGEVIINGRVGSLLEVGTGFHPELTGRENVFMNGSILGMERREILRRFDDIVSFAAIERFVDTPVKRYSSGMYVRLAFAVAAFLDPGILIIDEVLSVGDAEFQKKCLGRMQEIGRRGRTVIFVSHNMAAVSRLCDKAVLLNAGAIQTIGSVAHVIDKYTSSLPNTASASTDLRSHPARAPNTVPLLASITFLDKHHEPTAVFGCGDEMNIALGFDTAISIERPQVGIGFDDNMGQRVFSVASFLSASSLPALRGHQQVICRIPEVSVAPGTYTLSLSIGTSGNYLMDALHNAVTIEVAPSDFYGNGRVVLSSFGPLLVRSTWSISK